MPYIEKEYRKLYDPYIDKILESLDMGNTLAGDVNYIITRVLNGYLSLCHRPTYQDYNAMIGVLECTKQELYRRKIAPYEDRKRKSNGDVFK